jgi:cobalt-zinc-cadmium efflux system protein
MAHDHAEHDHDDAHGDGHRHGPEHAYQSRATGHAHSGHAGHGHAHGHAAHAPASFDRAFAIGIGLNAAFVAVEAWCGWRFDSLALLADAAHNLGDVFGLLLAWAGTFAARWQPDARHSYGFKRASLLAAVANGVLLLVAMGSLAWEAAGRLGQAAAPPGVPVMAVAAVGIVINAATAMLFMRGRHDDVNLRGAFLHMAGDAAVSAGVVVAGALTLAFGWGWLDPVASLLIAAIVLWGTWSLLRDALHLLGDGVPAQIDLHEVHATLEAMPGVAAVCDLHVWAMGSAEVALTAHLVMPEGPPGDAFLRAATVQLRQSFGIAHVTLQPMRGPLDVGGCGGTPVAAKAAPARGG